MRARRKSFEDLPDWVKCCPAQIAHLRNPNYDPLRLIEVFGPPTLVTATCQFCQTENANLVLNVVGGGRTSVEFLDLDEGGEGPAYNYLKPNNRGELTL